MPRNIHSHTWVVGLVGLAAGLYLLIYVPSMTVVSSSLLLLAGFHLLGGLVTLGADLTALPFDEGHFDSAISTNVFDHLGRHKQQSLNEVYRVLKPGGRFLLAVWTPGWPMFAIGNLLSLLLTSRSGWLRMAQHSGFTVRDQGVFNFAWFVLLEKPV